MLNEDISRIFGIGNMRKKQLSRLGINKVCDMLFYFPRGYEDRSKIKNIFELTDGETAAVKAVSRGEVNVRFIRKGFTIYTITFSDDTGNIECVWYNNPYIKNAFSSGNFYTLYGKVNAKYGKKQLITPVFELSDKGKKVGKIVPIYPLTASLTQNVLSDIAAKCIESSIDELEDPLPPDIRRKYELCEIKYAVKNIHFPDNEQSADIARRRLAFEELFTLRIGLSMMKTRNQKSDAMPLYASCDDFFSHIPFNLTQAQKRVISEIYGDIQKKSPMNRLLQGDVGSGKTTIAAFMLYAAAQCGSQGVLMAPTEILARQHYEKLSALFPEFKIVLLTGHGSAKTKKQITDDIKNGNAQIIIGTHALLEGNVEFHSLSAVVTDEQHRFGVSQRKTLENKGVCPHILIMSATPIPRTLSLILYGDLDISVIDELPPGRQTIDTYAVSEDMRTRVYTFLKKQTDLGRQAYIICPLVEESDKSELKNVTDFASQIENLYFNPGDVAILHGKLSAKLKNEIMDKFASGEIKVLVSTTVVEVGVDVPNASVMIIENAERFGLSQLHQLRGRVGRGQNKSYCILFSDSNNKFAVERMKIMTQTCDGFKIAEKDLLLRGPGEFFGTRQHGAAELKIADISADSKILAKASEAASEILKKDPALLLLEHAPLKRKINRIFDNFTG